MELGFLIGWLGALFIVCVAPPQLLKILRSKKTEGVSLWTYIFLVAAVICYTIHAIHIGAVVFIVTNGFGVLVNGTILIFLIRGRYDRKNT